MKKLLLVLSFFILAPAAFASTQVLIGGVPGAIMLGTGTATSTLSIMGSVQSVNNSGVATDYFPVGGTLSSLYVSIATAPGGSSTRVFTIYDNATQSSITCDIGPASNDCTDLAHTLAVSPGDYIEMRSSATAAPATTAASWSLDFVPATANATVVSGGGNNANSATSEQWEAFDGFYGSSRGALTASNQLFPEGGTLGDLGISTMAAKAASPGAGGSYSFGVTWNGATSTLGCVQSGSATGCTDSSDSLSVSRGDSFTLYSLPTGTPTALGPAYGALYTPSTAGDFGLFLQATADLANATTYYPVSGFAQARSATESLVQQVANPMTITSMTVSRTSAAGAGHTITYTLDDNGSPTSLSCSLSGSGSGAGITTNTCTGSVAVAAGDLLDVADTLDASGVASLFSLSFAAHTGGGGGPPPPPPASLLSQFSVLGGFFNIRGGSFTIR